MKLLSWNINGIRAVYQKGFTAWVTKSQADIICLQETKADLHQLPWDLQFIPKYELYLNPAKKKGYSGTAVFSKNKPLNIETSLGMKRFDAEGRIVRCNYKNFSLINVYIPNGARDQKDMKYKLDFYTVFIDYLEKIKDKNIIIAGDFNVAHQEIDLARPSQNQNNTMFTPKEREQIQNIIDLGFVDTFRMFHPEGGNYSWLSYYKNFRDNNIGWRIDYILVSKSLKNKVKDAYILKKTPGSDHVPVGIDITI